MITKEELKELSGDSFNIIFREKKVCKACEQKQCLKEHCQNKK